MAARSPVPLVLYNIPYRTGRGLGAAALLELAATDGIVGLKQAVGAVDIDTLQRLAHAPADFAVLCGDDAFLLPLLLMGAAGAIAASAHLCTERFAALIADAHAGRLDDARAHAEAPLALVLALFAEPSPAVLKAMLHDAGRIATPDVRNAARPRLGGGAARHRRHPTPRALPRAYGAESRLGGADCPHWRCSRLFGRSAPRASIGRGTPPCAGVADVHCWTATSSEAVFRADSSTTCRAGDFGGFV